MGQGIYPSLSSPNSSKPCHPLDVSLLSMSSPSLSSSDSLAASYVPLDKCGGANLPPNDPYNVSITNLLGALINDTPQTGFASGSAGQGVNQVYGLALCRGDLNATACKACVERSSKTIQANCQDTQAIAYDDECEVRYSDTNFLGQVDHGDWFYFWGLENASNPVSFNQSLMTLLNDLSQAAYGNSKFFAEGSISRNSTTIYAVVQCTKDLAVADCESCLTRILDWVPQYLYGKNGGKLVGGSCNMRFEIFKFFSIS